MSETAPGPHRAVDLGDQRSLHLHGHPGEGSFSAMTSRSIAASRALNITVRNPRCTLLCPQWNPN